MKKGEQFHPYDFTRQYHKKILKTKYLSRKNT